MAKNLAVEGITPLATVRRVVFADSNAMRVIDHV